MLNKLGILANRYNRRYRQLVLEFPFLKPLIMYSGLTLVSFVGMFVFNSPIFWRLGGFSDFLTGLSVVGFFGGFFMAAIPYIMANEPSQSLVIQESKKIKKSSGKPWWYINAFLGSIALTFVSLTLFAIVIAFLDSLSEVSFLILSFVTIVLFVWGFVLFIKSIHLIHLTKKVMHLIVKGISPQTWIDIYKSAPHFTLTVSIDDRSPIEKLQDEYEEEKDSEPNPLTHCDQILRSLRTEDFLIINIKDKPAAFVQYIRLPDHIRMEIPIPLNKGFEAKKKHVLETLRQESVYTEYWKFGMQLNPDIYYQISNWMGKDGKKRGEFIVVNCRYRYARASQVGLRIMESVYNWDKKTKLTYSIDTFNDSLWRKIWG